MIARCVVLALAMSASLGCAAERHVQVQPKRSCRSAATPLSLEITRASCADVVNLVRAFSGMDIRVEVPIEGITVTSSCDDVPWDCYLEALARRIDAAVIVEGQTVRLVARAHRARLRR